jgi:glyoxylase-like metal-dependent hydrolase (beta-lactamase superfamily II)
MNARLTAISGLAAKGPACFLVEANGQRVLLDLGRGPKGSPDIDLGGIGMIDAVVLSHSHVDHTGALHWLERIGNPTLHATEVCGAILGRSVVPLPVRGQCEIAGITVETGRTGHAPGGVWLRLGAGEGLLYMSDHSVESVLYDFDPPPKARTIIVDASYGDSTASLGPAIDKLQAMAQAGPLLLPAPPDGRGPELAIALSGAAPVTVCPATRTIFDLLEGPARVFVRAGAMASMARLEPEHLGAASQPRGVMVAAGADADSGVAEDLAARWHEAGPAIVLTGYFGKVSTAARLVADGRAEVVRWNVHPRLQDAVALVRAVGADIVLPAFGDFGATGQSALAPANVIRKRIIGI